MTNLKELELNNPTSYEAYYHQVEDLVAQGMTTGPDQSEELAEYTKINFQRMRRWNKMVKPSEELLSAIKSTPMKMKWVAITEGWCGDAAQNFPFIAKLAELSGNVDLEVILRDENHDTMNKYLTNGGMSIPKVIMFDAETGRELANWGPRPAEVQEMVMDYKKNQADSVPYSEFSQQIHLWYAKNRNKNIDQELISLIQSIN